MDGLSGAASLIAVVSFAVQLGESIYKLSKLLKSIQNAPTEVQVLANDLDRLRQILAEVALVAEMQRGQESAPAPSTVLFAALDECQLRFQSLEAYASRFAFTVQRKGFRKALAPLKIPIEKDALQKLHGEMRQSVDHLGTLLVLNTTKIQLAHLNQTQKLSPPMTSPTQSTISLHGGPFSQTEDAYGSLASDQTRTATSLYTWHKSSGSVSFGTVLGLFRYCVTCSQSYFSKRGQLPLKEIDSLKRSNWSIVLFSWFMGRYFEFQSQVYRGQVERRWRVCPVDPRRQSPAWMLCESGDTEGILELLSQGLSPYLKDAQGRSLLNAASKNCHFKLCQVLLQHGVRLCAYQSDDGDNSWGGNSPLFDINPFQNSMEQAWETIKMIVDSEDELEDASLALVDDSVINYSGNQVFMQWAPRIRTKLRQSLSHNSLVAFCCSPYPEAGAIFKEEMYLNNVAIDFILRGLGQGGFSITYEKDLSLLDKMFNIGYLQQRNIWDLEADSEHICREWCLTLDRCGIDAEGFVQKMMNMNGGDDVYLEPIDYGARGTGGRRLLRGETKQPSLRWEWDPPPKENPYQVLEEFGHLYIQNEFYCRDGTPYFEWPFRPFTGESDEHDYIRRGKRKVKKAQRRDKVDQYLRKIPGAFPD